jgi:hypothetical protein
MSWQIQIPFRHPEQPLAAVGELANHLESDEDCAVARQLVISGVMAGMSTAGELIERVEALDNAERRRLLDAARGCAGLDSTHTVEARHRFEGAMASAALTAAAESPWQTCAAEGCNAIPTNALGAPVPVDARRWWCPAHVDQAAEGDMQPRPPRLRYNDMGLLVEFDPVEEAREAKAEESHRRRREEREAERRAQAEEHAAFEQAQRDQLRRELPEGFPA